MQVADVGNGHLSSVNLLSSINLLWPVFRGAFFRGCVHLFHHIRFSRSLPASLPDLQSLESKRFHRIQKFLSKQNNVLRTSSFEISDWRSSLSYMKAIYRRCQRLSLLNSPLVSISSFCSQRFDEFWFEVSISSANLALTQQCLVDGWLCGSQCLRSSGPHFTRSRRVRTRSVLQCKLYTNRRGQKRRLTVRLSSVRTADKRSFPHSSTALSPK